jgi:hypothetical protein
MSTLDVEDMSSMRTSRKKLLPVRAHRVYHSLSKPSPAGAPLRSAALTGSGAWSPARTEGTFKGKPFHARRVLSLRRAYQLKDYGARLRQRGLLTADEAAKAYGVCRQTIMEWGRAGLLPTYRTNDRGMVVFPPPDEHAPVKHARKHPTTPSSYERSAVCN